MHSLFASLSADRMLYLSAVISLLRFSAAFVECTICFVLHFLKLPKALSYVVSILLKKIAKAPSQTF